MSSSVRPWSGGITPLTVAMTSSTVWKWCEMIVPHGPSRLTTAMIRSNSSSPYTDSRMRGGAAGVRIFFVGVELVMGSPLLVGPRHNNVTLLAFPDMGGHVIDPAALADLLGRWWFNYDEGNFDVLTALLTDDVHLTCRTDSDSVAWAEFAKADVAGRDKVMAWQIEHRRNSPYPLRHHGTNVHIV